jgi:hypothetical protein
MSYAYTFCTAPRFVLVPAAATGRPEAWLSVPIAADTYAILAALAPSDSVQVAKSLRGVIGDEVDAWHHPRLHEEAQAQAKRLEGKTQALFLACQELVEATLKQQDTPGLDQTHLREYLQAALTYALADWRTLTEVNEMTDSHP